MFTIDTHCHASASWFEPIEVLLFQMDSNAVDKAVLIQHRGEYDNSYLLESAKANPGRFTVVGIVDTAQHDAPETLAHWATQGIQGVRFTTRTRSPGSDPLAIWRKAAELGLVASCLDTCAAYTSNDFQAIVKELPDLPIMVEHFGFWNSEGSIAHDCFPKLMELAHYPNLYLKTPGFAEYVPRPFPARNPPFDMGNVPPYIDMAIEAFGAERMTIGTDYPPSSAREGYPNTVRYIREYLARFNTQQQEAILGGTAASLFHFDS
jgi:predicted TIM-barrel fold metal-dependent hydrolase